MMVLSLTVCPDSLRGDLTKWLIEISTGVFVGQVSARVREQLWRRVQENSKGGRALLVFNTNNEQKLDFRTHGETWEPIGFDGIKLMLRPNPARLKAKQTAAPPKKKGFSNASKMRAAKRFSGAKQKQTADYVVVDLETTGLDFEKDKILEISALKIKDGKPADAYYSLVAQTAPIPAVITALTGITDEQVQNSGAETSVALKGLCAFIDDEPIVAHNVDFDKSFLEKALTEHGFASLENRWIDTLALSRMLIKGVGGYKLKQLAAHLGINVDTSDGDERKSMKDCMSTHLLYQKLINLGN